MAYGPRRRVLPSAVAIAAPNGHPRPSETRGTLGGQSASSKSTQVRLQAKGNFSHAQTLKIMARPADLLNFNAGLSNVHAGNLNPLTPNIDYAQNLVP